MPVTALDPKSALVVIDMQKGIIGFRTVHPASDVLAKVVQLADVFRAKDRPVVLVTVGFRPDRADAVRARVQQPPPTPPPSPDFSEIADELHADPTRDILIRKRQWGAFYGTDLDLQLRRRGTTNIVLCGISTSIGVESTARDAWEWNYNITFASDATTDMNQDAYDRSMSIIFPRLGEIGTTQEILRLLG